MPNYRICGLSVSSELTLPGAVPLALPAGDADVAVRYGRVPEALPQPSASGPTWQMEGETLLLRVPRLARFLIAMGRDITVELEPGATEHDASAFVLGTSFGILLHQRGALVLHGAAVAKDGRAIAICGVSGAGKSTLAAALCRDGLEFVTDDLCVVGLDAQGRPIVYPDGRQLKLWRESIDRLDLAAAQGQPVRATFEKYFIEPSTSAATAPHLTAIYILREAGPTLKEGIESLTLPDAIRRLDYEAYRPGLRAKIGQKPQMLAQAATLLGHTKMFQLVRPVDFKILATTVTALRAHWDSL